MTFGKVACPLLHRQWRKNEVVRDQRALDESGMDPAQRRKIVGMIRRAGLERAYCNRQATVDGGMAAMQASGRGECLIERPEHHREDDCEGSMKAIDRVAEGPRVFNDGRRDPRVSKLKQEGAAGAEKCERLAIDAPSQRIRTEHACLLSRRERSDHLKLALKVFAANCGADHS